MRRLLLALLIVMLPLRGWIGDVMAMQTVDGLGGTIETIAADDHSTLGTGRFDAEFSLSGLPAAAGHCPDHAVVPAQAAAAAPEGATHDHSGSPTSDPGAHGGACNACQVCHSLAMHAEVPALTAAPLPAPAPAGGIAAFTSAVPAPGLKPPIS